MDSKRLWIAAALASTLGLATGAAHARHDDVQWSVTIGSPQVMAPRPVYTAPPVYRAPAPIYHPHHRSHPPTRWDDDGDGIPNHRDRFYNPVWDRDGDGIPNRRDARYTPPWDRDGDGIPNRYDRYDRYDRHDDRSHGYRR